MNPSGSPDLLDTQQRSLFNSVHSSNVTMAFRRTPGQPNEMTLPERDFTVSFYPPSRVITTQWSEHRIW